MPYTSSGSKNLPCTTLFSELCSLRCWMKDQSRRSWRRPNTCEHWTTFRYRSQDLTTGGGEPYATSTAVLPPHKLDMELRTLSLTTADSREFSSKRISGKIPGTSNLASWYFSAINDLWEICTIYKSKKSLASQQHRNKRESISHPF